MEFVAAPVFHENDASAAPVAVKTELAQLSVTKTEGAKGMELTVSIATLEITLPAMFVHIARY